MKGSVSLKKNVAFNYFGQLYATFIGIIILPMYLKYVGPEAYGLIGFYTLVQSWMRLMDLGMTPTLSREIARLKNYPYQHWRLLTVVNTLESVFLSIAFLLGSLIFMSRGWIANEWLHFQSLSLETVSSAVGVIAVTVSLRWLSSLSRSGVNAYEKQVWTSVCDIIVNTLRFPGSLILIICTSGNVLLYFYFQLGVVVFEVLILRVKLRSLLPHVRDKVKRFSIAELKRVLPFAVGVGYTGAVWVLLTQLDKLLLSNIMPLSEYGYFTLVVTMVSGLSLLSGPISKAILPRMTSLLAVGDEEEMIKIYRTSTRFVAAVIIPITLLMATFPEMIIYSWTGDVKAALWAADILPIFAIGSGFLALISFQYYIQYAHGVLKYHVFYNTLNILIAVPAIFYTAYNYGVIGVAWLWLALRLASFFLWVPYVHHKLVPHLHMRWLVNDILPAFLVAALVILAAKAVGFLHPDSRILQITFLGGLASFSIGLSLAISMQGQTKKILSP